MKFLSFVLITALIFSKSDNANAQASGSVASRVNAYTKVDPPTLYRDRDLLGSTQSVTIEPWFESSFTLDVNARDAVREACKIWGYILTSDFSPTINVKVRQETLADTNTIATGTPGDYVLNLTDTKWYPRALAKASNWQPRPPDHDSDIVVIVNSYWINGARFYYGLDGNTPTNTVDFLTIILHELAHGLGFSASFRVDSATQFGRKGIQPYNEGFGFDHSCIRGPFTVLHKPDSLLWRLQDSTLALGNAIKSNVIYFGGQHSYEMTNSTTVPKLFAPSTFKKGSSISHLDDATYPRGTANSLMKHERDYAEAVHSPGELGLAILQDVGWPIKRLITFVQPIKNTVVARGDSIQLVWTDNQTGPVYADLLKRNQSGMYFFEASLGTVSSVRGTNPAKKLWIPTTPADTGTYKIRFINETFGTGYGATVDFRITVTGQVERVVLYPPGNTYGGAINVTMGCATQGATIRYTTSPTGSVTESSPVCPPEGLPVPSSVTLKAKAFKAGLTSSETSTESYVINPNGSVVVGPLATSYKRDALRYVVQGQTLYGSTGSAYPTVGTGNFQGGATSQAARAFLQWSNIPADVIPDSITSATLRIDAHSWISIGYATVSLYRTTGNLQNDANLWNSIENGGNLVWQGISYAAYNGSFQKTFYRGNPNDSAFINQLKAGLNLDHSLQIAVKSDDESATNKSMQIETSTGWGIPVSLTITYSKPIVRIAQVDSAGLSFGQWARYETNLWKNHPDTMYARSSLSSITARADTNYKQGTNQKYNLWTKNDGTRVTVNHSDFSIASNTSSLLANFKSAVGATVQSQLIDNGEYGIINFKDPWLIDDADSKGPKNRGVDATFHNNIPSPFKPDTSAWYKGVFLNENPNWLPNLPNYSVGAPASQFINGIEGAFQYWTTSGAQVKYPNSAETPVVFQQPGATVTANYKAARYSSSPLATASNNQRKIAQSSSGVYCMVFQAENRIWFVRSSNGVNWSADIAISDDCVGTLNTFPTIVASGNMVNIVWQSIDWWGEPFNGVGYIYLRRYNVATNEWGPLEEVATFWPESEDFAATPAIDAGSLSSDGSRDRKRIVWKENEQLKIVNNTDGVWSEIGEVEGTHGNCFFPSIINYNGGAYAVCWEDRDAQAIQYVESFFGGSWSWDHAAQVSPYDWYNNQRPSISGGYVSGGPTSRMISVAWQSFDNVVEGNSVHVRQTRFGCDDWGNITSYSMGSGGAPPHPVIGSYESDGNLSLVWNDGGGDVYVASYNGSSWSTPALLASGAAGGTECNINAQAPSALAALWRKSTGAIAVSVLGTGGTWEEEEEGQTVSSTGKEGTGKATELQTVPYRHNRHGFVQLSRAAGNGRGQMRGMMAVEIAHMKLLTPEGEIKLRHSNLANLQRGRSVLSSKPFLVTRPESRLVFAGAVYGKRLAIPGDSLRTVNQPLAFVAVRENRNGRTHRDVWRVPFSALEAVRDSVFGVYKEFTVDLNDMVGKELYVEVEMLGHTGNLTPLVDDDYLILRGGSSALNKISSIGNANKSIPRTYALHQNYPNPFNPVTRIEYQLPAVSEVTLKVFDVLGQEVMTLAHGTLDAGEYSVAADFTNLPSGMYIYRLTAGNFTAAKKLLVVK